MMKIKLLVLPILYILLLSSCKQEIKQKVDLLPDLNLEDIETIINNPATATESKSTDGPQLFIQERTHHFDTINQGDRVKHIFKIKNTGNKKLIFLDMRSSCGCTIAKKPKEYLIPNEESEIEVIFDSKGKFGDQSRKISIFTNCYPGEEYIELKGYVYTNKNTIKK